MCRGKEICTELGENPSNWDKYAPIRKPSWMIQEIELFIYAVDQLLDGNRDSCLEIIYNLKNTEMTNWFIEHGQMSGRHRKIKLNLPKIEKLDNSFKDPIRNPTKLQNKVFERDGFKCRYCGSKLISQEFIKLFIDKLNSNIFIRGKTNLTKHGIIHLTWPVADHIQPHSIGGKTSLDNLVSSCGPCNYGKDGFTIEQIGIENPMNKNPIIDNWKGLTNKIEIIKSL